VLELEPISRRVPTTIIRITATITAYSAMSWPSSDERRINNWRIGGYCLSLEVLCQSNTGLEYLYVKAPPEIRGHERRFPFSYLAQGWHRAHGGVGELAATSFVRNLIIGSVSNEAECVPLRADAVALPS
jgi:hypothetical protein